MSDLPRSPERRLHGFDYSDTEHAYFVTTRAREGTAPFIDERLAQIVVDSLFWLRHHRGIGLYDFVLMPDHLHLLLQLNRQGNNLPAIIALLKRYTTRESWGLGYSGAIWQRSYYDHIVRHGDAGKRIAAYILANSVRKGLVDVPEAYPYSGMPDPL